MPVKGLLAAIFWLDAAVCDQEAAHSFYVAGEQLPLCARSLGFFLGFLLAGLAIAARGGPVRAGSMLWFAGLAPMAVDGGNSFLGETVGLALYPETNLLRLVTGLLCGWSLAKLTQPTLARLLNPHLALVIVAGCALALLLAAPYVFLALAGTLGVLAVVATAVLLARPLQASQAWLLTLPVVAVMALVRHTLYVSS